MQPRIKLSITEPCHENWQSMNPTEQGRHCDACAKEVIDFTSMSDTEVLYYFINKKKENVCGRFYNDQLNREITKPKYAKTKMRWYWNYFVMLFLLLFKGYTGKSQVLPGLHPVEQISKDDIEDKLTAVKGKVNANADKKFDVSGKITDESGVPVAGASVVVKGKKIGTQSNVDGTYHLKDVSVKDILTVSSVGYVSKEMKANNSGKNDCVLKVMWMGEVVITGGIVRVDEDYIPPAIPTHVAVIEVRDNKTSTPVKASLTIKKDNDDKKNIATTNKNGIYKLRHIAEIENYTVKVSADGYKDSVLQIKGCSFYDRKETKYVFLQKEGIPNVSNESRRIIVGGASSAPYKEPLYVIDGVVANNRRMKNIKPDEIESIDILKDAAATALYGSRGINAVILITTKKKKTVSSSKEASVEDNKEKKNVESMEEKTILTIISDVKITPNPVQNGNTFNLSFTAKQDADCVLQIFTGTGALMQSQKVAVKAKANTVQFNTAGNWSAGIYYVLVNDGANNTISATSFVIE